MFNTSEKRDSLFCLNFTVCDALLFLSLKFTYSLTVLISHLSTLCLGKALYFPLIICVSVAYWINLTFLALNVLN